MPLPVSSPELDAGLELDQRPVAAIFRSPLFNASETFVQTHALALRRFQPLLVGLEGKGNARPDLQRRLLVANTNERLALKLLGKAGPLAARLRPFGARLIHAHFGTDGLLALPLAKALHVPLVTTLHGFEISRSRARLLLSGRLSWTRYALLGQRLRSQGELFIAVCEAIRSKALAQGFPADRTIVHYNGVDLTRFAAIGREEREADLVLHVGRLVAKKGTGLLLEALARLPGGKIAILGDGPLRPELERKAGTLGLGGRAMFLGSRPPDEVARWMGRAALLAAPSITAADGDGEGLPTVVIEAAAASLPAIVSDHSGLPEAVVDGESGVVVPEGDVAALARGLSDMLGSAASRSIMGAAARRIACERFDSARQGARLEEYYDRIVEDHRRCA